MDFNNPTCNSCLVGRWSFGQCSNYLTPNCEIQVIKEPEPIKCECYKEEVITKLFRENHELRNDFTNLQSLVDKLLVELSNTKLGKYQKKVNDKPF